MLSKPLLIVTMALAPRFVRSSIDLFLALVLVRSLREDEVPVLLDVGHKAPLLEDAGHRGREGRGGQGAGAAGGRPPRRPKSAPTGVGAREEPAAAAGGGAAPKVSTGCGGAGA